MKHFTTKSFFLDIVFIGVRTTLSLAKDSMKTKHGEVKLKYSAIANSAKQPELDSQNISLRINHPL